MDPERKCSLQAVKVRIYRWQTLSIVGQSCCRCSCRRRRRFSAGEDLVGNVYNGCVVIVWFYSKYVQIRKVQVWS
jgi:hypothetical protein